MTSRVEAVAEILWHRYSPDHEDSWPSPNADEYRRVASDILSALTTEPAAPEGQQQCATEGCDNPATNEFIRGDTGSHYCGDCFVKVIEVCETRTRPSEQAVTDEMVEAAQDAWEEADNDTGDLDACWSAALKAAMEAGR